ncbi:hypothetical protein Tco_0013821, partial [Tanacetum coccineum]
DTKKTSELVKEDELEELMPGEGEAVPSTAHYAQSTARCESTAVMFEDDIVQCIFLDGFESQMLRLRGR